MAREKEQAVVTPMKVPPSNIQAEEAILGGVLINNDAMNQVIDLLAPEDFYIVGTDINKYHLKLSRADKTYIVPESSDPSFIPSLNKIPAYKTKTACNEYFHDIKLF